MRCSECLSFVLGSSLPAAGHLYVSGDLALLSCYGLPANTHLLKSIVQGNYFMLLLFMVCGVWGLWVESTSCLMMNKFLKFSVKIALWADRGDVYL